MHNFLVVVEDVTPIDTLELVEIAVVVDLSGTAVVVGIAVEVEFTGMVVVLAVLVVRAGRYWSFASRYIVQKYITILLFIAVIKDDCYIRVADCFIRVSRT